VNASGVPGRASGHGYLDEQIGGGIGHEQCRFVLVELEPVRAERRDAVRQQERISHPGGCRATTGPLFFQMMPLNESEM
jgi:hypothetical protein